jgi:hypothetical protein
MASSNGSQSHRAPREIDDVFVGKDWESLRQGARNVAGVRFQIAVTALLLIESRTGERPFVELVPEGYEDIDAVDSDGVNWYLQVKEVGAGAGTFNVSRLAEVMTHASAVAGTEARVVAVTDGVPGNGLVESGWDRSLQETEGVDFVRLRAALANRGHNAEQIGDLLRRTYFVRVPWNASVPAVDGLARAFDIPPALASFVFSALVDDLSAVAADQRGATAETAGRRRVGDLDELVGRVLDVVDRQQLDSAVRAGVCGPAEFTSESAVSLDEFLLGVDAEPAHIAAGFDVIRPTAALAVQEVLADSRYALLAGPSGAGKSAQMWRSARDAARGARVVRVHRIADDVDLQELIRHVRILLPTAVSPVVVACDDLGRPHTAAWSSATRRLLEVPNVQLLGAVRNEDLTPELLRHGGVLIELTLDAATARTIAEQFEGAGMELTLEVAEAVSLAAGQLMEFVALLTTGRRLRAVLSDQAHHLITAQDPTAAEVARVVCAAHVLGVSIHADRLADLAGPDSKLTSALQRLQAEHIITSSNGELWQGLHQRRSAVLTELLHQTPPPTLRSTLTRVVDLLPPAAVGWALRRSVEIYGDTAKDWNLADSASAAVSRCATPRDCALLLEGLERVDRALTARAYLPVLERHRRPTVPLLTWAFLVLGKKLAGINIGDGLSGPLAAAGRGIEDCASELPEPSTELTTAAAGALGASAIADLSTSAGLEDAVRLLEVAGPYVRLAEDDAKRIFQRFPWPDEVLDAASRRLNGRLVTAVDVAVDDHDVLTRTLGAVKERLERAARAHPDTLAAQVATASRVELELLASLDPSSDEMSFPWDLPSARSRTDDPINHAAVELATYVGDCCPEAEIVEVRTVTADRQRLRIGDFEPGHKRLGKNARPDRNLVRLNVGLQAAIGRQASAHSWTELARQRSGLAEELASLVSEAPRRLGVNDKPRRRIQWVAKLGEVERRLAQLPRPPLISEFDPGASSLLWDSERNEEPLVKQLRQATAALRLLVRDSPGDINPVGVAGQLEGTGRFAQAIQDSGSLLLAGESASYGQLDRGIDRLRGVLLSVAFDSTLVSKIKGRPGELASTVDRLIDQASHSQLEHERRQIADLFASVSGATVHQIPDPKPFVTSIVGHQWVVTLPPHAWEEVETVAADAAARSERVVDVPVTLVCEMEGRLLPIAGRLSRMTGSGLLPVDPQAVGAIADALGMARVEGAYVDLVARVVEELAKASWLIARSRHRPETWPESNHDARAHLQAASELLAVSHHPEAHALMTQLMLLIQRVQGEVEGDESACLAAAITRGALAPGATAGADLEVLAGAQLNAIEMELSAVSSED